MLELEVPMDLGDTQATNSPRDDLAEPLPTTQEQVMTLEVLQLAQGGSGA